MPRRKEGGKRQPPNPEKIGDSLRRDLPILRRFCDGQPLWSFSGPIPTRRPTLEEALESIEEDELAQVTPGQIRLRKIVLRELGRKRLARRAAQTAEA